MSPGLSKRASASVWLLLAANFPREPVPEETHPPRVGRGSAGTVPPSRHQVKDDEKNQFRLNQRELEERRKDGGSSLAARKRFLSGCDPRTGEGKIKLLVRRVEKK